METEHIQLSEKFGAADKLREDKMQSIALELNMHDTVNYAMQQNDVPVINSLRIRSLTDKPLQDLVVTIKAEPCFASTWETRIAAIAPGMAYNLGVIDLPLVHDFLAGLTERILGTLQIQVRNQEQVIGELNERTTLLAYDEWGGLASIPEILAAFVLPNHPEIERILAEAAAILGKWTGDSSLSGYQSKSRARVLRITEAIYVALQQRNLRYINPPASFEESGQKIRLPDRIFANNLATCLDLSVLVAACLEQCGLNPLLLLTEGHAFVGVWLDEETFADCVSDDVLRVRKRVELEEICVFETTFLTADTALSFAQACTEGKCHLENPTDFRIVLDVKRARKSQIRPLPLRIGLAPNGLSEEKQNNDKQSRINADSITPVSSLEPISGDGILSNNVMEGINSSTPEVETTVTRLDGWKRKLLDLSKRNQLINFQETKKSLAILCPSLVALEDALADGEKFTILPHANELGLDQPRNPEVHRRRTGKDAMDAILLEEFHARRLHIDLPQRELERRLLEIYRKAKISLEENGANTLYLALGFLNWYESESSEIKRKAPIVLLPMEIDRRSVLEGFTIRQADEEPMVNITLLEMLKKDFQINITGLDQLPVDEHGLNLKHILNRFRQAVKQIDRWEVTEEAYLAHFSFAKFLMWRDLEMRTTELQRNKVVRHLITNPSQPYPETGSFPKEEQLDELYCPEETFCPLSADSSQLAAVYAAAAGKSFVLHGPPGTGKSQTITNIIAHALATGKSVLFVSEKMAALNVVHKRLEQSGLGPFCLELHSHKSNKKEVYQQFRQALEQVKSHSSDDWLREANKLASLRNELNAYVKALHKIRETGESVFYGLTELIRHRDVPAVDLAWPIEKNVDRELLTQLRDVVHQLAVAAQSCPHPALSVWAAAGCKEWSPAWRKEVDKACQELMQLARELQQALEQVVPLVGLEGQEWSKEDLHNLDLLAQMLLTAPVTPSKLVAQPDWEILNTSISQWIEHGRRRDEIRAFLYQRYTPSILQLDLEVLAQQLAAAEKEWALPRWFGCWRVQRKLSSALKPGAKIEGATMGRDLEMAIALREEEELLDQAGTQARELLGHFWRDGEADWVEVAQVRDLAADLRRLAIQLAGTEIERAQRLRQRWSVLLSEDHKQLAADGAIGQHLVRYRQRRAAFLQGQQALVSLLELDPQTAWGDIHSGSYLKRITERLQEWLSLLSELQAWCIWRDRRHRAIDFGLAPLITAYEEKGLAAATLELTFTRSFYQWWVDKIVDAETALKGFYRQDFEDKIRQFREVDERYLNLTKAEIYARLAARVPDRNQNLNQNSEMGILYYQLQRQRRQMPIRQLFQRIPNLLPLLKPCLLMSPISVAQYLDPAHPPFDLVIFDEASQIPVWDAVGAIARGEEVIIVGDPQQLPPTNFFMRTDEDELDNEDTMEDLESILDDCLAAQLPQMHLNWHYRSRHESLIAFSNYQYYENRLLTFPSPYQGLGVSFRAVNGCYDRAKSRTNLAEAKAVVEEIIHRFCTPALAKFSIGVVTFSLSQQRLIEDILEKERRNNPDLEAFFDPTSTHEPIFIKNLENVQGDERDVILFSICYGPDEHGKVAMTFGPLNRDGGERRLNVAITRARQEVIVFSTLRAEQIDLTKTRARGVADLKCFLDYAVRGPVAFLERQSYDPAANCESPFEEQVRAALQSRGYTVHAQVGCSGYRIDLAVVDPEMPGRYILGIECDGANYHRAKTARDRDRLREDVLRERGWQIHRIWSSDWWERPEAELARLEAAIEAARKQRRETPVDEKADPNPYIGPEETDISEIVQSNYEKESERSQKAFGEPVKELPQKQYQPYESIEIWGELTDFYQLTSNKLICQAIEKVVAQEGPVSLELVMQRVATHWVINRLGPKVRERIKKLALKTTFLRTRRGKDIFLWPNGVNPETYRDFRLPGSDKHSQREANVLPPEEIANAALFLLRGQVSLPIDDLVQDTARLFGFQRTGPQVYKYICEGIMLLVKRGEAREQDRVIVHLPQPMGRIAQMHN